MSNKEAQTKEVPQGKAGAKDVLGPLTLAAFLAACGNEGGNNPNAGVNSIEPVGISFPEQTSTAEAAMRMATEIAPDISTLEKIPAGNVKEINKLTEAEVKESIDEFYGTGMLRTLDGRVGTMFELLIGMKDGEFVEEVKAKKFFETDNFEVELFGIQVVFEDPENPGEFKDKVYLFFETTSNDEPGKGFISYAEIDTEEGLMGAASLERIEREIKVETEEGIKIEKHAVLALLQDPISKEYFAKDEEPVVIWTNKSMAEWDALKLWELSEAEREELLKDEVVYFIVGVDPATINGDTEGNLLLGEEALGKVYLAKYESVPAAPEYPAYEGESWEIADMRAKGMEIEGNFLTFEPRAGEERVQYQFKNTEKAENIRFWEKKESKYKWPMVVAEIDGETMVYDFYHETWLPMIRGDFSKMNETALKAVEILVKEGKLDSLEDLETMIDWSEMDPEKGGVGQVDRTLSHEGTISTSKRILLNLFRGGGFRLYFQDGKWVEIDRFIFNENESSDDVKASQLFAVVGGVGEGSEIGIGTPIGEESSARYGLVDFDEMFPPGSYVKVALNYEFEMSRKDLFNEIVALSESVTNGQNIDKEFLSEFIRSAIYDKKILTPDFVLKISYYVGLVE